MIIFLVKEYLTHSDFFNPLPEGATVSSASHPASKTHFSVESPVYTLKRLLPVGRSDGARRVTKWRRLAVEMKRYVRAPTKHYWSCTCATTERSRRFKVLCDYNFVAAWRSSESDCNRVTPRVTPWICSTLLLLKRTFVRFDVKGLSTPRHTEQAFGSRVKN